MMTSQIQRSGINLRRSGQIKWACPSQFMVDPQWQMATCSESREIQVQLQRESRIFETVYYHISDIPDNPIVAYDAHDSDKDDNIVPVIPLDVVNDETSETTSAAKITSFIESNGLGNQIDLGLLIQLLSNPGMVDQLMKDYGLCTTLSQPQERPKITGSRPVVKVPVGANSMWVPSVPFTYRISQEAKHIVERVTMSESRRNLAMDTSGTRPVFSKVDLGKIRELINEYGVPSKGDVANTKDSDYYRRLILRHGTPQKCNKPQGYVKTIGPNPIEPKHQEQGPCVYFNTVKGCRRGSSCWFKHVNVNMEGGSRAVEERRSDKRMKVSGRSVLWHHA